MRGIDRILKNKCNGVGHARPCPRWAVWLICVDALLFPDGGGAVGKGAAVAARFFSIESIFARRRGRRRDRRWCARSRDWSEYFELFCGLDRIELN